MNKLGNWSPLLFFFLILSLYYFVILRLLCSSGCKNWSQGGRNVGVWIG